MIAHAASWVLPVSAPPLRDGAVVVESDLIVEVGTAREVLKDFSGEIRDHGNGAILPGLVNCHVHLEFSALAGRVPPQDRWEDWLDATLSAFGALTPQEVEAGIAQGVRALWQSGTILAGEVTNTGASWSHLRQGPLDYHLFYECLGFHLLHQSDLEELFPFFGAPAVGNTTRVSAGAHAPYSVSPALFGAVGRWNSARGRPQTVHLAESQAELDFLARGDGFFRDLLKRRGRWVADFQPPGLGPAAYLAGLDFLGPRTLAVHGVWLNKSECELLARTGTRLVICLRANRYTGAGTPPVPELMRAGVPLALGTDSLAGNWDLNLFGEMLRLYEEFPAYPGDLWLRLGTLNGARPLGREADLGSLEPGKKAAMGFIPLTGSGDFWGELFTGGAAGEFRWLN